MSTIVERIGTLSVGRVESVTAEEVRIALFDETPQATALNTGAPTGFPRINAYVLIPNETGAVVAVVKQIYISSAKQPSRGNRDEGFVDLPFPARMIVTSPLGTLLREGSDDGSQPLYALERGVPVLPSVGDPVLLPSASQLNSIVEAKSDDQLVKIGTAPFADNASVWVHPDKIFGRHIAVLGNTGSGKSCSVAGMIRWSLESSAAQSSRGETNSEGDASDDAALNARFIILDPNGEYAEAFRDKNPDVGTSMASF